MRATGCITNVITIFSGSLDELKQLQSSTYLDYTYLHMAIDRNDIEMTKWLLQNNCPTTKYTHEYAARNGNLEIIKLLIQYEQYYSYYAVSYSSYKHIECFKYYFEHYCTYRSNKTESESSEEIERSKMQEFWNEEYALNVDAFDLDDPTWRKLFTISLRKYPKLQEKVNMKKKQIEELKGASIKCLGNYLPLDIIQYCIHPYF
jgi:hypothetical protein